MTETHDLINISDAIKEIIGNIPENADFSGFSHVYDYFPTPEELKDSPIFIYKPSGLESSISTNNENERVWVFDAVIVLALDNSNREDNERDMKIIVGTTIQHLERSWSEAIGEKLEIGVVTYGEEHGDLLVTGIELRITKLTDVS